MTTAAPTADAGRTPVTSAELVRRARIAQAQCADYTQAQLDDAVTAVAWAIYEPARARALAELSVHDTGMGRVEDKIEKNRRKTFGTLRDLHGVASVGVVNRDPRRGIVEFAKPLGVVLAVCPSTNPAATPANKVMMAVKGGNAVIVSPSPKGASSARLLTDYIHAEFDRIGVPRDLVQVVDRPSKAITLELMSLADFVVVTGSQNNVRAAYSSGTPAIGVGVGNAPVIIAADADVDRAAGLIKKSKVFDYATSCSSENSVHIDASVYDAALAALRREGGYVVSAEEKVALERAMWPGGQLSPAIMAKPARVIAEAAGLSTPEALGAEFFIVPEEGFGPDHPFSGEKLSVVLTAYRYASIDEALTRIQGILDYQGAGHSCGIHTRDDELAATVAQRLRVARVLVNQAHCFGTGGSFENGLNFTLTMGAGSWAGNSISENLSYRHFLNITRLATPIPAEIPSEDELFGAYLAAHGG